MRVVESWTCWDNAVLDFGTASLLKTSALLHYRWGITNRAVQPSMASLVSTMSKGYRSGLYAAAVQLASPRSNPPLTMYGGPIVMAVGLQIDVAELVLVESDAAATFGT